MSEFTRISQAKRAMRSALSFFFVRMRSSITSLILFTISLSLALIPFMIKLDANATKEMISMVNKLNGFMYKGAVISFVLFIIATIIGLMVAMRKVEERTLYAIEISPDRALNRIGIYSNIRTKYIPFNRLLKVRVRQVSKNYFDVVLHCTLTVARRVSEPFVAVLEDVDQNDLSRFTGEITGHGELFVDYNHESKS
jgi:hypothetical protein